MLLLWLRSQPVVNEDTSGDVTALRADNERLQRELAHLRTMVQVCTCMPLCTAQHVSRCRPTCMPAGPYPGLPALPTDSNGGLLKYLSCTPDCSHVV
jgi:hypothetical protein